MVHAPASLAAAQLAPLEGAAGRSVVTSGARSFLWLAVHLPDLDAAAKSFPADSLATEADRADRTAAAAATLNALAHAALRFTSVVSVQSPAAVLLELSGSVRLFGGLEPIRQALLAHMQRRGLHGRLVAAPAALAALWLARAGGPDALDRRRLAGCLAPLPLTVTGWPDAVISLLADMGVRTVGDCLRLPRDGFTRRAGKEYLRELDVALLRVQQPRPLFQPADRIELEQQLPVESCDLHLLIQAADRLLQRAVVVLRQKQVRMTGMQFRFHHRNRPPTHSSLTLVEPVDEPERLHALMRDRFERIALPAPVRAITLRSGRLLAKQFRDASLFDSVTNAEQTVEAERNLLERFLGRLGGRRVRGVALAADHRPERACIDLPAAQVPTADSHAATSSTAAGTAGLAGLSPSRNGRMLPRDRPLWLLQTAQLLNPGHGWVWLSGPERIDAGWWDGEDAQRDYYTIRTAQGQRLWVYRDRRDRSGAGRWYLHGLFG